MGFLLFVSLLYKCICSLFFCLIGQLAALDRGADPAVELRTVEGAVVGLGVELVLVHGIGGVEVYQYKVGVIARLELTLGKAQNFRRAGAHQVAQQLEGKSLFLAELGVADAESRLTAHHTGHALELVFLGVGRVVGGDGVDGAVLQTGNDPLDVLSGAQDFEKVPENGELKESEFSTEMLPQRKLDTYGRSFSMSRQAFINDDIGFIATVPGRFAQAAKRTINKQCYQLLYNNAAVFDGKAFFSADHKNLLTTGTGMTSAAIKEMRQKLRTQTDQFGEAITLTPNFLILPVSEQYDNDLVSIFMSPTIQTTENTQAANPLYRQNYDIIEDNTLNVLAGSNACPWFMGDKGVPCVKVDYLNGNETPNVRRSEKARTLGFIWDFWLDWGITATDFRSMVKNPGVAL